MTEYTATQIQHAKQDFERGRIQPSCPNCGPCGLLRGRRVKMTEQGTYNTTLAVAYQCVQCEERFVAYIGAPIDGKRAEG